MSERVFCRIAVPFIKFVNDLIMMSPCISEIVRFHSLANAYVSASICLRLVNTDLTRALGREAYNVAIIDRLSSPVSKTADTRL
jgi:hypothetical protein